MISLCLSYCLSLRYWNRRLLLDYRTGYFALSSILSYWTWHFSNHSTLSLRALVSITTLGTWHSILFCKSRAWHSVLPFQSRMRHRILLNYSRSWTQFLICDIIFSWAFFHLCHTTLFPLCQTTFFPLNRILSLGWATRFKLDYCHLPSWLTIDNVYNGCLRFNLPFYFVFYSIDARRLESIFKDEVCICMAL